MNREIVQNRACLRDHPKLHQTKQSGLLKWALLTMEHDDQSFHYSITYWRHQYADNPIQSNSPILRGGHYRRYGVFHHQIERK